VQRPEELRETAKERSHPLTIQQARMPEHESAVHELFAEYLRWVCAKIFEEYRAVFDPESMIIRDMLQIDTYMPPKGALLIACDESRLAGCACTRTIGERTAEMKRMYVRPAFRRRGIGAALVRQTIEAMQKQSYSVLRLDSAQFMTDAHSLYRSFGFRDIAPYKGSEIPVEYQVHWVFMELQLDAT
jgi:ribosomal protein S18 acetylase RimI-like enzyme